MSLAAHRPSPSSLLVTAAALVVAAATVLPLLVVGSRALRMPAADAIDYLVRPRIAELLLNTLGLVALTVPATLFIGITAAWLVERTDLPGAGIWRVLLAAPLAIPAFVASYAWTSFAPGLHGLLGAALVTTLAYFPFVYLPVAAILRDLDGSDEELARSQGLGPLMAVHRTVIPRLRPAMSGGALLVGLHLLAEYGVLEMMRFPTLTTAILTQYSVGFSNDEGSLLAVVLVGLCLTLLGLEMLLRGTARVSRVGSGTHQPHTPLTLGRLRLPALLGLGALVVLSLALPLTLVGRWLVRWVATTPDGPSLLLTTGSTIGLAAAAALVATLAALPGAWLLDRRRTGAALVMERTTYLASALPGVVVGLALVTVTVRYLPAIYQSASVLVIAYAILFVPRAMVSLRAGLAAAPPELVEAARSLGASGPDRLRRVLLPLVAPSMLTGAALVLIASATELTATLLLAPTGTSTLATAFWAASDELDYVGAAPYAAMMILLSAPLTILLLRQSGTRR